MLKKLMNNQQLCVVLFKSMKMKRRPKIDPEIVKDVAAADRIYIIAAGTNHAGLVGKEYLEKWAGVPTEVHVGF